MKQFETRREIKIFMKNIAYIRKKHGLSKREMAKLLKIGVESLNKLESGELPKRLSVKVLFEIERHFGVLAAEQFTVLKD